MKSRRVAVAVSMAAATVVAPMTMAAPAQASPVGAYLVVNNWRCAAGGTVQSINGAVDIMWSGGDAGDNIIYATVDTNRWNQFNGRALCVGRPWWRGGSYWINVPGWDFYPTRSGQTFYW